MLGAHTIKTWSKTQAVIAKSSAEAELYAVVRGGTEGLGMLTLTLLTDLGLGKRMQLHLDASAAKSIVGRQGLSKARHVDVNVFWLQETCARKLIPLKKVAGKDHGSDMLTKNLTSAKLDKNLTIMHTQSRKGRSEKAAKLHLLDHDSSIDFLKARAKLAGGQAAGDRWLNKGLNGVWQRVHSSSRLSLFTPFKLQTGRLADMNCLRPDSHRV